MLACKVLSPLMRFVTSAATVASAAIRPSWPSEAPLGGSVSNWYGHAKFGVDAGMTYSSQIFENRQIPLTCPLGMLPDPVDWNRHVAVMVEPGMTVCTPDWNFENTWL